MSRHDPEGLVRWGSPQAGRCWRILWGGGFLTLRVERPGLPGSRGETELHLPLCEQRGSRPHPNDSAMREGLLVASQFLFWVFVRTLACEESDDHTHTRFQNTKMKRQPLKIKIIIGKTINDPQVVVSEHIGHITPQKWPFFS